MGQTYSLKSQEVDTLKKLASHSAVEVLKIKERFELFCDSDRSLAKDAFGTLFKLTENEAEELFGFFDSDQSGKVNLDEFICGLTLLSSSSLKDKATILFKVFDEDHSHALEISEVTELLKTCMYSLTYLSQQACGTEEELDQEAKNIISRWDNNHDGKLTLNEFRSNLSKDPEILKCLLSMNLITRDDFRPDFGGYTEGVPDCDSDLEEEAITRDIERDPFKELIKHGFEHAFTENEKGKVEIIEKNLHTHTTMPWLQVAKLATPTTYKPHPELGEHDAPEAWLELDYVHGYRCHDTRNNIRYNSNGELVYHTAGIGIVLDTTKNQQKFFMEHTDDIVGFCMSNGDNTTVVTGQIGHNPLLCIWDSITMACKLTMNTGLQIGICTTCISNDGKIMAAISLDGEHCIEIYDVAKLIELKKTGNYRSSTDGLIVTGRTTKAAVFDMKFDPSDQYIILACNKEINFLEVVNGALKITKLSLGKQPVAMLTIGFLEKDLITGAFNGALSRWRNKSVIETIKAHDGPVTAIYSRKQGGLITGGNDGRIYVWDKSLKKIREFDMNGKIIGSMCSKIRALAEDSKGNIAVGTRGGEICEFPVNGTMGRYLIKGHYDEELWGLACSPIDDEYVTVGEDCLLAIWDIKTKKQLRYFHLECAGKVCAYSSDGKLIGVGCENGHVIIFDSSTLDIKVAIKDRVQPIIEMKFSPKGDILAVGAEDAEIFLYNVQDGFRLRCKMRGHHSTINHFDFSQDGNALQSNSASMEHLYFNTSTGKRHKEGAVEFKDEAWATWTCIFGWPVQGIWPPISESEDINAVDRHPQGNVIATADDFSKIKLFKYPCPAKGSSHVKYVGHSDHVTSLRFSRKGDYLISTGGYDKSIFQWRYYFDDSAHELVQDMHAKHAELNTKKELQFQKEQTTFFQIEELAEGDQLLAVKPFLGEIAHSIPSGFKPNKSQGESPNVNLTLSYCHGYRCFDAQNCAKYTSTNKVVFVGAALGVLMEPKTKAQSFFQMHEEDIICLAIDPKGKIAATGQMAQKGKAKLIDLFVWDIETKQVLANLKGFHLRAVCLVNFSPDGTKLLSVGQDDDNSLAIHDWPNRRLISTSKVDKAKVMAAIWKTDTEFMTCGLKHVKFFNLQGANITGTRGKLDPSQSNEAFLCAVYQPAGQVCFTGTQNGNIIPFNGRSSSKTISAHTGPVWSLYHTKANLFSGGKDGKVLIWTWSSSGLQKVGEFCDMAKISKFAPGIRSLDAKNDGKILLVGTRGSEIYEVEKGGKTNVLLLQGHYDGELWGCSASPNSARYVTCGGDQTIRLWDAKNHWMLASTPVMENDVRAVDWSQNGNLIVAGDVKGKIWLLSPSDLKILDSIQSSFIKIHQWIEDIKFSPDSSLIAFGAHGGVSPLEIFAVSNNKLSKKCIINCGVTSAITHLDWSTDGSYVVLNSEAWELKYINISSKKPAASSGCKDFTWATWTCRLGWPVQGVHPDAQYQEIHTVCRSQSQQIVASGDNNGHVNLYKYPSYIEKSRCKSYIGHSSHITKVKFAYDDSFLMSTGGNDKCILVWETDFGKKGSKASDAGNIEGEETTSNDNDNETTNDSNDFFKGKETRDKYRTESKAETKVENGFIEEKVEAGDQFMAIKPWIGAIKAPSTWIKAPLNQSKPPQIDLTLDYVFGYRAKDMRNNLRYLKNGNIVYNAAGLGIVLDIEKNEQRFFNLHTDDITAIDVHPDGILVATGEVGPHPVIYIWNSNTMQPVFKLKGTLEKGIVNLGFSKSGDKLAAVAIDVDHHIAVYDAKIGALISTEKGDASFIVDIKFKNDTEFVTVGPKHFKYWTVNNKSLSSKRGQFGDNNNILSCVAISNDDILVGASDGKVQFWRGNSIGKAYQYHSKPVDALYVSPQYILTGGKDCLINVLDKIIYAIVYQINFEDMAIKSSMRSMCGQIRSLCFASDNKTVLIGTYGSEIYQMKTIDTKITKSTKFTITNEIMKGHYTPNQKWTNEIWGLAVFHKDQDKWATVSDDSTLRIWSKSKRKQLQAIKLDIDENGNTLPPDAETNDLQDQAKARCLDICQNDELLVVGFREGTLRVFSAQTLKYMKLIKKRTRWISIIKFSPDNKLLAVGSHNDIIDIYTIPDFQLQHSLKKHSSFITHLDWSTNSCNLQSNCGAYELLFWDITTGKQMTSGATALRDEKWATWTCVLGWPVQGIWPQCASGKDINYVDRSKGKCAAGYELLASGDDWGKVRILRYPSIDKGSEGVIGVGHSSHVTNVRFSLKDDFVFSCGGEDNCVFQWSVKPKN